ncbi:hypothetical protein ACX6XY_07785 [Streptomyces sp. O3]
MQIALVAAYSFWFFPTFAGGIGPEGETYTSDSSNLITVFSIGVGGVIIALDGWGCHGMLRSLRHRVPAARQLMAVGVAQLALAACATLLGWGLPVAACALAFALLAACYTLDRRNLAH